MIATISKLGKRSNRASGQSAIGISILSGGKLIANSYMEIKKKSETQITTELKTFCLAGRAIPETLNRCVLPQMYVEYYVNCVCVCVCVRA